MVAHREFGELAWRRRQIVSISLLGSVRVLGMSRKEERVLMPGGVALISSVGNRGAGGGEEMVMRLWVIREASVGR